jgi:Nucleoporin autopeptidase
MTTYSQWQPGSMSAHNSSAAVFKSQLLMDEGGKVFIHHISFSKENSDKCIEEIRHADYKKGQRSFNISQPTTFGPNSVTPPRMSSKSSEVRPWTQDNRNVSNPFTQSANLAQVPNYVQAPNPFSNNAPANPFASNYPATGPSTTGNPYAPNGTGSYTQASSHFNQISNPFMHNGFNPQNVNPFTQSNLSTQNGLNFYTQPPNPFLQGSASSNSGTSGLGKQFGPNLVNSGINSQNSGVYSDPNISSVPYTNSFGSRPTNQYLNMTTGHTQQGPNSFFSQNPNNLYNPSINSNPISSNTQFYDNNRLINPMVAHNSVYNPTSTNNSQFFYNNSNFLLDTSSNSYGNNKGNTNPPSIATAFKDPQGLSWLFPNQDPEKILKAYKEKESLIIPEGIVSRVIKSKKNASYPNIIKNKFEIQPPKPKSKLNPFDQSEKTQKFEFKKREKFANLKFEEYSEDGIKYLKAYEKPSSKTIEIIINAPENLKLTITIDTALLISDLKHSIKSYVASSSDFVLVYNKKILNDSQKVESAGILNGDEVLVQLIRPASYPSENMLPKVTKFKCYPSLSELSALSPSQLRRVKNFGLENQHGLIVFDGETDVTGLDIDKCLSIEHKNILGHGDSLGTLYIDPRLNKPALVTLFNFKSSTKKGKTELKLRINCGENGTEFVSFNEATGELSFRIKHL